MCSHELLLLEDARVALIAGETRTGCRISPEQNVEALVLFCFFFFALELKRIVPFKNTISVTRRHASAIFIYLDLFIVFFFLKPVLQVTHI